MLLVKDGLLLRKIDYLIDFLNYSNEGIALGKHDGALDSVQKIIEDASPIETNLVQLMAQLMTLIITH